MVRERDAMLVHAFRHSTPYVNHHRGSTFVIMLSGETVADENFSSLIADIALLQSLGIRLVLVFGARPQIDAALIQDNIPLRFHKHVRVTDDETFSVVKQVCGGMQMDIMAKMSMGLINTPMAGAHLNVVSGNFVTSQPLGVDEGVDRSLSQVDSKDSATPIDRSVRSWCSAPPLPISSVFRARAGR